MEDNAQQQQQQQQEEEEEEISRAMWEEGYGQGDSSSTTSQAVAYASSSADLLHTADVCAPDSCRSAAAGLLISSGATGSTPQQLPLHKGYWGGHCQHSSTNNSLTGW
jgi:hypothetical protein